MHGPPLLRDGCCALSSDEAERGSVIAPSEGRLQLQMLEPARRWHVDMPRRAVPHHVERHGDAGAPERANSAIKVGEVVRLLAIDPDDDVAAAHPCLLGRTAGRDVADEQAAMPLFGGDAEP